MCERRLLTAAELARQLRISPSAIYELHRRGTIPALRVGARTLRFDLARCLEAVEERGGGE